MLKRKRRGREKKGGKRTKEDMIYRGKGHFLLTNTTYSAKGGWGGLDYAWLIPKDCFSRKIRLYSIYSHMGIIEWRKINIFLYCTGCPRIFPSEENKKNMPNKANKLGSATIKYSLPSSPFFCVSSFFVCFFWGKRRLFRLVSFLRLQACVKWGVGRGRGKKGRQHRFWVALQL